MRINWVAAAPWLCTIGLFALWEGAVWLLEIAPYVLPPPSLIAAASWEFGGALWNNSIQTLWTTMAGFGIAVVFGLALGLFVGWDRTVYAGLYPLMVGFNSIPKVAVVPILVIWFGSGWLPAVLTAFLISFFPIVVNVATGLATIEPEMEDVLRALGAKKLDIMTKVGIPRSLPYFFGSLKIAITLAFIGSVLSETQAANEGLGHMMLTAQANFEVPLVFACLLAARRRGYRHVRHHGVAGDAHDRLGAPVRVRGAVSRNSHLRPAGPLGRIRGFISGVPSMDCPPGGASIVPGPRVPRALAWLRRNQASASRSLFWRRSSFATKDACLLT